VRLEFFGDELESSAISIRSRKFRAKKFERHPATAGELGVLKQHFQSEGRVTRAPNAEDETGTRETRPSETTASLATLLDLSASRDNFSPLRPEQLAARADEYAQQIPENDPFSFLGLIFCPA